MGVPDEPEELPPWPRHWRNWQTVRDEGGRLAVVRPQQLELPAAMEASSEEGSLAAAEEFSGKGAAQHAHDPCVAASAVAVWDPALFWVWYRFIISRVVISEPVVVTCRPQAPAAWLFLLERCLCIQLSVDALLK